MLENASNLHGENKFILTKLTSLSSELHSKKKKDHFVSLAGSCLPKAIEIRWNSKYDQLSYFIKNHVKIFQFIN